MTVLLNIGEVLSAQARLRPDALGARDLTRSMTFAVWEERASRLANALLGLGLSKGDRFAVLAYNRIEWVEIYAAAAKSGLVAVPINFRLTATEAGYIAADSGAKALIVEAALLDVAEAMRPALQIPDDRYMVIGDRAPGYRAYEDVLAAGAARATSVSVVPDDPWCFMYTSGTTGHPKGAIRGHRGMAMLALMTDVEFRLNREDHTLLVMPMCHANSLNFFTSTLYAGGAVTIFSRPSYDPELCLRTLTHGITFSSMVPTHYAMMLDVPAAKRGDVGSVEKLLVSSATAFPSTKRAIMEMFPNSGLYELYGSTEQGWVTMLHPHEQFDHLGTVGREVVGSLPVRILDDDGNEVPDGEPGELFSCGPYQFDGYWNLPEKTVEAMRGDYLSVGDIAVRDAQGFIRLVDRKKNMIVSGGENIYPSEVESVLSAHPDVRDVAVIGVKDPKWSERVVAAVVLREGASLDSDDLIGWSKDKLAGFKRPRHVVFLTPDEMPRNATGKILHRRLREMLDTPASTANTNEETP